MTETALTYIPGTTLVLQFNAQGLGKPKQNPPPLPN